jgi:predicted lipoprotein
MSAMRVAGGTGPGMLAAGLAVLVLLAGCAAAGRAGGGAQAQGLGARVLREYIQPATRALQDDTSRLAAAMGSYCASPADALRRTEVESHLGEVAASWAAVEVLRFGPLVEQNRLEQFFFWPDPRGVLQRQMRTVLAGADRGLLEPSKLRAQSVAVQGLPALEYALYADDAQGLIARGEDAGRFRCDYAIAVAANLERLAREIDSAWNDAGVYARELARPAPQNILWRNDGEVATEVLKALSTALHVARDQKLQPPLGEDAASARASLLPLQRSALTARYLLAGIEAISRLHAAGRFAASLPEDSRWIDSGITEELQRVREDFDELGMPVDRAVADESRRELLVHAALLLANVRAMVDEYLAPALGVNLGFNSLDGD